MQTRLRLLFFALAVPLLAALAASTARDRWDDRWSAGLEREFRASGHGAGAAVMARYSLRALCRDPRRAAGIPACRTYDRLSSLIAAAGGVAALGLAWFALVAAVAAAARRGRARAAFRPVVFGSAGILVVLLAAQGLLAVQATWLAGGILVPRSPLGSLGSVAGLAAALWIGLSSAQALRTARRMGARPLVLARALREGEAPALRALVRRLRPEGESGGLDLVAGLAPAAFVVPGPIDSLDGRRAGPVLHVSLTLARILTVPECEALLAAQVARVRDRDARSAARAASGWLRLHEEAARLGGAPALSRAAVFPARWWLAFVVESFEPAAAAAWLEGDAAGDRAAVAAAGREAFGAAVVKVRAFAGAWEAALRAMAGAAASGEQYVSASRLFEEIVAANAEPVRVEGALAALPLASAEDRRLVAAAALDVRPAVSATNLLGDAAARLDEDLTIARHLQLRRLSD